MKHLKFIIILLFIAINMLYSQTIQQPWWVVDHGSGKSTADTFALYVSIGQPIIQKMTVDTFTLESGFIPGLRTGSGSHTTHQYSFTEGWNMVSIPLLVSDYSKSTLFPTAISKAFGYMYSYIIQDTLKNGEGYWLKFPSVQTFKIFGTSYLEDTLDMNTGWNMIGVGSFPVLVSNIEPIPPLVIKSQYFGYSSTGYYTEDTLKPGYGYWIKVDRDGKIVINSSSMSMSSTHFSLEKNQVKSHEIQSLTKENNLHRLIFKDASEHERILYFTAKPFDLNLERYELPPLPPSGIFDVRFQSQRNIEIANKEKVGAWEFPIQISGEKYPLTISWDPILDETQKYLLEVRSLKQNKILTKNFDINDNTKSISINERVLSVKLLMKEATVLEVPKDYALHQNYPNPFNPKTVIKYDLPFDSKVLLKLYNILGQEVMILVDEVQSAGYQSVELDGTKLTSGVYLYHLTAGEYKAIKKLVLLK